eukprot:scaffold197248_cov30-Tisochrysis_lutea.AAC.3
MLRQSWCRCGAITLPQSEAKRSCEPGAPRPICQSALATSLFPRDLLSPTQIRCRTEMACVAIRPSGAQSPPTASAGDRMLSDAATA